MTPARRALPGLSLSLLAALTLTSPSASAQPPPTLTIRSIQECNLNVPRYSERTRCKKCIQAGGTFHTRGGSGRCALPAPPPPPESQALRTLPECNLNVPRYSERARCRKCVKVGGTFHTRGGAGQCDLPAPPPPPPPPADQVLRTVPECLAVGMPFAKRQRCKKCTRRGWAFHTQGAGYGACVNDQPPPPPPREEVLTTVDQCKARVPGFGERRRCYKCVRNNGRFHLPDGRCDL